MSDTVKTQLIPQTWTNIHTATADGILMIGNRGRDCVAVVNLASAPASADRGHNVAVLENHPHPVASGDKVWAWSNSGGAVEATFAAK